MAHFIFVHGTFAAEANWPLLQAGLIEAARSAGENATFEQIHWSGKNRAKARSAAATSIWLYVERKRHSSPSEKIFVIGHSHGGSAIAYFLKWFTETAGKVAGCAFLSTPFVAIRPRENAVNSFTTLSFFLSLIPVFISFFIIPVDPERLEFPDPSWYVIGLCVGATWAFRKFVLDWRVARLAEDAMREQTANMPGANCLFIRASGDEAAAALSAAQFIAWASAKSYALVERLTRPLLHLDRRLTFSFVVLGFFGSFCTFEWVLVDMFFRFPHDFNTLVGKLYFCILVLCSIIAIALIVCVFATYFVLGAQAVMARAFGWTDLLAGFLTELAIEPLPFGTHSLVHIDWSDGSFSGDGIVHGWTYSHPRAVEHIRSWVVSTLSCGPAIS
jgi:hypothetical protein